MTYTSHDFVCNVFFHVLLVMLELGILINR